MLVPTGGIGEVPLPPANNFLIPPTSKKSPQ